MAYKDELQGELISDDLRQTIADLIGLLLGGGLGHHAHQRLGTGRTQQHATGLAEHGLFLPDGLQHHGVGLCRKLIDIGHIDQRLRQLGEVRGKFLEALAGLHHLVAQSEGRHGRTVRRQAYSRP